MRRTALWTMGMLCALGATAAHAGEDPDDALQQCARIEDDAARLTCYDKLAHRGSATDISKPPTDKTVGTGRWEVRTTDDSLGRGETVSLILGADRIESSLGLPVFLVLRCVQGRPELFIDWRATLGHDAFVISAFGDEAPQTLVWDLDASGKSSFYPSRHIDGFVMQLVENEHYVATAPLQGGDGDEIIAHFSPAGLTQALERMRSSCGWSPTVDTAEEDDGPRLSAQDREYREQALANFYDRCDVDPEGAAGEKAYADWANLSGLGYSPRRIWQLSKKIPKSCRVQSFRDEILSRGDP